MEDFVSEKDFVLDLLWDVEPVKVLENRADVIAGEQQSSECNGAYLFRMLDDVP